MRSFLLKKTENCSTLQNMHLLVSPYYPYDSVNMHHPNSILIKILPEDPAFNTGDRPIFKCNYICIGSTYSRNQNRFNIFNQSSIKSNLTLDYKTPNKKLFTFENQPTYGTKSGVFRYFNKSLFTSQISEIYPSFYLKKEKEFISQKNSQNNL